MSNQDNQDNQDNEELMMTADILGWYNQFNTELDILMAELELCQDEQERMIVIQDIDTLLRQ